MLAAPSPYLATAAALDPVIFARSAALEPDNWQAEVLRSAAKRMLLNCSRQSGKSTITAAIGLHQATYVPDSLVLLLSPSQRQSAELFRKVADLYTATGATVPPKAESALRLELTNGSRIVSLPGTEATVRGFSGVDLLVIDEASRVEDALFHAVTPMLAVSDGRLIALSTPYGKRGWWSNAWHSAEPWYRVEVPATMCPRISPDFLEDARRSMGEWWYQQEFMCEFLDSETQMFSTDEIERAFSRDIEMWEL